MCLQANTFINKFPSVYQRVGAGSDRDNIWVEFELEMTKLPNWGQPDPNQSGPIRSGHSSQAQWIRGDLYTL